MAGVEKKAVVLQAQGNWTLPDPLIACSLQIQDAEWALVGQGKVRAGTIRRGSNLAMRGKSSQEPIDQMAKFCLSSLFIFTWAPHQILLAYISLNSFNQCLFTMHLLQLVSLLYSEQISDIETVALFSETCSCLQKLAADRAQCGEGDVRVCTGQHQSAVEGAQLGRGTFLGARDSSPAHFWP